MTTRIVFRGAGYAALWFMLASPAAAYIGPGVGAGAIAAVFGVIGSIFLAIVAIVYYPIKRMLKRRKATGNAAARPDDAV